MRESSPRAGDGSEPDVRQLLLEPDRLSLVAQPIVDLRRAEVVGYEALSRFVLERPSSPDKVFAAAARQGVAEELEALVIARGFALADGLPANCFLSLNVDPSLLTCERVVRVIESRRSIMGLVFELTEHTAIENLPEVMLAVASLKARGALVAMDDAGAGYSGLKQLLDLRPQLLKLDRALISGLDEDPAKRALVQMIGELAGRLDAWLLAEGIETRRELEVLRQLGVPLGQGYFLARPAAPWAPIRDEAQAVLTGARASIRSATLAQPLVEVCPTCSDGEPWPPGKIAIRLTAGRPIGMRLVDEPHTRERGEHQLMRVKRESPLAAVAQRAVTRVESECWDPLVCVDDLGQLVGIIRMARLVSVLAEQAREKAAP